MDASLVVGLIRVMRIDAIVAGISTTLAGIAMYQSGWSGRYQLPIPPAVGLFCIFIGLLFFVTGLLTSNKKSQKAFICNDCKKRYSGKYVEIPICPKCNGDLVEYEDSENGVKP